MAIVTLQEAYDYIGIDEVDTVIQNNVRMAVKEAEIYVKGIVGEDIEMYLPDDERLKIAILMRAESIYSRRDNTEQAKNFEGLIWQLQIKLANAKENADVR